MSELVDQADWSKVSLESTNVQGRSKRRHVHNGISYATEGERLLAELLDQQGVPFTPNVKFVLGFTQKGEKTPRGKIFVPDFIFNKQAYVWTDPDTGEEEVIHGLEAKNRRPHQHAHNPKTRLLWARRRIRVRIISTQEIRDYIASGGLPLRPL